MTDNPAFAHPALAPVVATGVEALTDHPRLISETVARTVLARVAWESYQAGRAEAIRNLLTADQAGSRLGISGRQVRHLAEARGLGWRVGRRVYLFTPADVERMRDRKPGRPRKAAG